MSLVDKSIKRRDFLKISAAAALAVSMCLGGCGSESQDAIDHAESSDEASQASSAGNSSAQTTSPSSSAQVTSGSDVSHASASERSNADAFYIHVNGQTLAVTPADNSSADALLALLEEGDILVDAHDYGNFEKVGDLPQSLPTNDEQITTEAGDVILYQGDKITVYYAPNSWNFTRLGKVQGVSADELKSILGSGDAELRLSLE